MGRGGEQSALFDHILNRRERKGRGMRGEGGREGG